MNSLDPISPQKCLYSNEKLPFPRHNSRNSFPWVPHWRSCKPAAEGWNIGANFWIHSSLIVGCQWKVKDYVTIRKVEKMYYVILVVTETITPSDTFFGGVPGPG